MSKISKRRHRDDRLGTIGKEADFRVSNKRKNPMDDYTTCTIPELWQIRRTLWYYMDADQRQAWGEALDAKEATQRRIIKAECHAQASLIFRRDLAESDV